MLLKKIGRKRGTKYLATERLTGSQGSPSSCFSSTSLKAIAWVNRPLFERRTVAYAQDWVEGYQPNHTFYLSGQLRDQLFSSGQRASGRDPAGTYAHQIFNRLIIDLSYNSSRLEGNSYTLLDTEKLLLHGESAEGKLDEEKIMILNHKEAIRYLVDSAPKLGVTRATICTLHYLLADGLLAFSESGKVRKQSVRIGGSTYMPFEDPRELEQQLETISTKAALIQDPCEQSFFLLVHISYLQAFIDVNKRTARLSANIPLIKNNLAPLAFSDVGVADYRPAMIALYELQDLHPLVDLYAYSYMRTCAAYDSTVKAIEFDEIRVRYRQARRGVVRKVIEEGLIGRAMGECVLREAAQLTAEEEREAFIEDVLQDLEVIDESRLAGLGITPQQLQ